MRKAIIAFVIIFVFILPLAACAKATVPTPYQIALVTPDDSPLWTQVDTGCQAALAEIGIHKIAYSWVYPGSDEENPDVSVNDTIAGAADEGIDVLIVAGLENADLSGLSDAMAAGVQVIWIEGNMSGSALSSASLTGLLTTIAADEKEAGKYAGELLINALTTQKTTSGTIGLCAPSDADDDESVEMVSADVIQLRQDGFSEAFAEETDFTLKTVSSYGNTAALFGASASDLLDAAAALKDNKNAPVICGFGEIYPDILDFIDDGTIAFSVIPDFDNAGYLAVKTAYAALTGGAAPEALIDSGAIAVTTTNSSSYRIAEEA